MAAASSHEFDPQIIERHVAGLLRKSSAILIGSVVLGVIVGATFGATPLTSLAKWPIPKEFGFMTMLVGGIVGGVIGYVVGDTRSFMYQLQAQIALAQVKAAQDSDAVLSILRGVASATKPLPARPAAPKPTPPAPEPVAAEAPKPVPVPAPAPAPVAAPDPAPLPDPPLAPPRLAAVGDNAGSQPLVSPPVSS